MAFDILYPDEENEQVHRHSSIDQFADGFISTWKKGGWAPIVFDQLDGINCETIKSHPVVLSFGDIGYVYPEGKCVYSSDRFVYFDEDGVEQKLLPECFGGKGEFYEYYSRKNAFVNFDSDDSIGVHNTKTTRVGLSYVLADETLPPAD